jgi:hypothetical protein
MPSFTPFHPGDDHPFANTRRCSDGHADQSWVDLHVMLAGRHSSPAPRIAPAANHGCRASLDGFDDHVDSSAGWQHTLRLDKQR